MDQEALTVRQQAVMRLVTQGYSNQQIAASLGISDQTVARHLNAIYARWNVSSRVAAALRYVRESSPDTAANASPGYHPKGPTTRRLLTRINGKENGDDHEAR